MGSARPRLPVCGVLAVSGPARSRLTACLALLGSTAAQPPAVPAAARRPPHSYWRARGSSTDTLSRPCLFPPRRSPHHHPALPTPLQGKFGSLG